MHMYLLVWKIHIVFLTLLNLAVDNLPVESPKSFALPTLRLSILLTKTQKKDA